MLYLDLWYFGRIRVRWNQWRMGRRGGRKRNNSRKNEPEPVPHSGRVLESSSPTNSWDRNCWKVVCLHFQGQKNPYWYIGRATRRFLNDEDGLITTLEIDCLKWKLGVTDNVLKQGQQDIGIFTVKDVICGPLQMFPLQHGRWECPKYNEICLLFEIVKKDDREQLYNQFVCSMLKEIDCE